MVKSSIQKLENARIKVDLPGVSLKISQDSIIIYRTNLPTSAVRVTGCSSRLPSLLCQPYWGMDYFASSFYKYLLTTEALEILTPFHPVERSVHESV